MIVDESPVTKFGNHELLSSIDPPTDPLVVVGVVGDASLADF